MNLNTKFFNFLYTFWIESLVKISSISSICFTIFEYPMIMSLTLTNIVLIFCCMLATRAYILCLVLLFKPIRAINLVI